MESVVLWPDCSAPLIIASGALYTLAVALWNREASKRFWREFEECERLNREQDEQLSAYFRGEREHPPLGVQWEMR